MRKSSPPSQAEQDDLLLATVVGRARRQIGLVQSILLSVNAVVIALNIHTMTVEKSKRIATQKLIVATDRSMIAWLCNRR